MTWHCLQATESDPSQKIHEAWVAAARGAVNDNSFDPGCAVFRTFEPKSHGISIYFSPAAEALALEFGAAPCKKPSAAGIGLLVGDKRAWEMHFPGETDPLAI